MAVEEHTLMTSLYVGDLHPDVAEKDLADAFGCVGPLLSVHICRDRISRQSLCYGYVNFWFRCHAATALKCLNHTRLKGKSMRVMWCERNPMTRKNNVGNLFVKNLDKSITGVWLQEIFSKYGTILSCKVAEEKGVSKGFGFVQFNSEDSAVAALHALHDTILEGKKLYVSKFLKRTERKNEVERCFKNLYVTNLDDGVTEDLLKEKFSEHGQVTSVVIVKDEEGKSKGYGFVNFDAHEGAKKAMEALNGEALGWTNISVAWAQKRGEKLQHNDQSKQSKALNLHVKNLDPSVDDRKLKELFSQYGKVASAKVIRDSNGMSKKFGFVRFLSPDEANEALKSVARTDFEGRTLHVALARRQEQQTHELLISSTKFQPQPSFMSNCPPPECHQFPYLSPLMPAVQLNQWDPSFYRNLVGPFGSCNAFQAQDYQRFFNYREYRITPSSQVQEKITGDVKEYSKGHGAMRTSLLMPSREVHKIGQGYMCHPLFQNLQPGLAASGQGLQLEMMKYVNTWRILNASRSLANAYTEKAE